MFYKNHVNYCLFQKTEGDEKSNKYTLYIL